MYENIEEMVEELEGMKDIKKEIVIDMLNQAQEMLGNRDFNIKCLTRDLQNERDKAQAELTKLKQENLGLWDRNLELEDNLRDIKIRYIKGLMDQSEYLVAKHEERVGKLQNIILDIIDGI